MPKEVLIMVLIAIGLITIIAAYIALFKKLGVRIQKRCRHQFAMKDWTDLNRDPQCIHCKKWLDQILKEESVHMEPDPDGEHYTAIRK
ncbi:MAG TPA: hypothetical protein VK589_29935 [Chryseolinea sp.]|nr:hypothetical protein [Chryseolinea sp.]